MPFVQYYCPSGRRSSVKSTKTAGGSPEETGQATSSESTRRSPARLDNGEE